MWSEVKGHVPHEHYSSSLLKQCPKMEAHFFPLSPVYFHKHAQCFLLKAFDHLRTVFSAVVLRGETTAELGGWRSVCHRGTFQRCSDFLQLISLRAEITLIVQVSEDNDDMLHRWKRTKDASGNVMSTCNSWQLVRWSSVWKTVRQPVWNLLLQLSNWEWQLLTV